MELKELETKFGTIYVSKDKNNVFTIYDSDKIKLFFGIGIDYVRNLLRDIEKAEKISDWLEQFDDVCWGSKEDIIDFTKGYQEMNGREFDADWLEENYNRIGDTYIMFEYSECWKEED